jgi:outer membrane receptor protein involved in Fe transport
MNNALDKEPTIVGDVNSLNGNTLAGYHDALGRYVFGSVTFRF